MRAIVAVWFVCGRERYFQCSELASAMTGELLINQSIQFSVFGIDLLANHIMGVGPSVVVGWRALGRYGFFFFFL